MFIKYSLFMKRRLLFFSIFFSLSLFSFGTKYSSITLNLQNDIKEAFLKGNARLLSLCFNDVVDLVINGVDATYSRYQAEVIFNDFFQKNPPKSFQIVQEGKTSTHVTYTIANFTTSSGCIYRVYYVIKKTKKSEGEEGQIFEINITKNKQCQLRK